MPPEILSSRAPHANLKFVTDSSLEKKDLKILPMVKFLATDCAYSNLLSPQAAQLRLFFLHFLFLLR